MAEGTVTLPPDSTGKVIRTLTGLSGIPGGEQQEVVAVTDPNGNPIDPRLVGSNSRFYTLLNQMILNGNEMRTALQATGDPNSNYFGTAVDGTSTTALSWDVLRIYLDTLGNPIRWRTVTGVAWSNAILGDTANPVVWV